MLRTIMWVTLFGWFVGGCAGAGNMDDSRGNSSTSGEGAAISSTRTSEGPAASRSTTSEGGAAGSSSTMLATTPNDSGVTIHSPSSQNRIAAGVEEETLESCLGRIPNDATTGQKLLAEQTCRRDFATRR
jgi:hypothetical protein